MICITIFFVEFPGLAGESLEEQARVDMFAETINDMRNPFRAIVLEKDPEKKVRNIGIIYDLKGNLQVVKYVNVKTTQNKVH